MKNKIYYLTNDEYNKIKFDSDTKVITIDAAEIHNWEDYWNAVSQKFDFGELPEYWEPAWYSYYDLITDLAWIEEKKIVLVLLNLKKFSENNCAFKDSVLEDFEKSILPFWDDEVERVVVDGKKREFNVYCVD